MIATRETALAAEHPLHAVSEWKDDSRPVAGNHYLRVTEGDFQKAQQYGEKLGVMELQACTNEKPQAASMRQLAISYLSVQYTKASLRGLELPADSTGKTALPETGGAKSGALAPRTPPIDPALAALIDAWPTLSEPIRAGILAMIRAAGG